MSATVRCAIAVALLLVLAPLVISWVQALIGPFVIVTATLLIARVVWFYTRM